jgi:hypothetical protein
MRVYIPATPAVLEGLLAAGQLAGPVAAYAVTPALRSWVGGAGSDDSSGSDDSPGSDSEELELVALSEAARGSLRLLAAEPAAAAVRVVLAADVPDGLVRVADGSDAAGPGQVEVIGPVELQWLRAGLVDDALDAEATGDVRAAADAVAAADAADAAAAADAEGLAAERIVARAEEHELLWYAPEELAALAGTLGSRTDS